MRYGRLALALGLSAAVLAAFLEGCSGGTPRTPHGHVSREAENARCFLCHDTYQDEMLSRIHGKSGVGCADCHGPSLAHKEDREKPPDAMFEPEAIAPFCAKCHETHDAPAGKVIALYLRRCPKDVKPDKITCTQCHGTHRLTERTIRWDKKTRQLIPAEKKS